MKKLIFVISQLYKGGAETALVNLLSCLSPKDYEIDLVILNQFPVYDAVSLISDIPEYVNVFDQWKETCHFPVLYKINQKIRFWIYGNMTNNSKAIRFVRNNEYDWAFHIGEWCVPDFCAKHVNARKKAVWIHTDISKSKNFDSEKFFAYDNEFDYYIFVSQNSLKASEEKFPFIKGKTVCINNILDDELIKLKSEAFLPYSKSLPVVVTCANIRPEKNHMRQIETMTLLRDKGVRFKWLNLGSTADKELYRQLLEKVARYNLSDDFLFLGAVDNPYPYMRNATAVAVLSDYESWSMVITEAKILGVPVIATKTSGALEQIEHYVTGVLCEFDAVDIAEKLGRLLYDYEFQGKIRSNIIDFNPNVGALKSFYKLMKEGS